MYSIINNVVIGNFLGTPVEWSPSPNHNGLINPRLLIFHYTGCSGASAATTFLRPNASNPVSAHLLVDRNGAVTQFVYLNERAWHAGRSSWGNLSDINTCSIGIEVVNSGYLLKSNEGVFKTDDGKPFHSDGPTDIVETRHKNPQIPFLYWESFTPEQIQVCEELAALLVRTYQLSDILGHDDIAPGRKEDPGPAFPMARIRGTALGRDDPIVTSNESVYVAVPRLNIRTGPGIWSALAGQPLVMNTKLDVLQRNLGWLNVRVNIPATLNGWVSAEYTKGVPL